MLNQAEIETIRAALLFWQEEICLHGEAAATPYFEGSPARALSAAEIENVRAILAMNVRYAICDRAGMQLLSTELWATPDEAAAKARNQSVATVVLPGQIAG